MNKTGARIILAILLLVTCIPIGIYFFGDNGRVSPGGQAQISDITVPEEDPLVSEEEAMQVVFDMLPGTDYGDILEVSQTYAEGGWLYRGSIKGKKVTYDFQVDGENSNLLRWTVAKK